MPESSGGSHLKNPWLLTGVAVPIIVAIISIIPLASLIKGDDDESSSPTPTTQSGGDTPSPNVDPSALLLGTDELDDSGYVWQPIPSSVITEFCGMDLVGRGAKQAQAEYYSDIYTGTQLTARLTFLEYLAVMDEEVAVSELREISSQLTGCSSYNIRHSDGSIAEGIIQPSSLRKIGDKSVSMRVDYTISTQSLVRYFYSYITYFHVGGLVGVLSVTGEAAEPTTLLANDALVSAEHKILGH